MGKELVREAVEREQGGSRSCGYETEREGVRGGEKASSGSGERRSIEDETLDNRLQMEKIYSS